MIPDGFHAICSLQQFLTPGLETRRILAIDTVSDKIHVAEIPRLMRSHNFTICHSESEISSLVGTILRAQKFCLIQPIKKTTHMIFHG